MIACPAMRGMWLALLLAACGPDPLEPKWEVQMEEQPNALLSVWGTSESDIWAAGAGQTVLHFDGTAWTPRETGFAGDLWWVFGFEGGPVYFGGGGGVIVRLRDGVFDKMTTPGTGTIFGIWGSSPSDVWAVGGATGGADGAFAWKLSGDAWVEAPGFPAELSTTDALWKVYGRGPNDVWLVGTFGKTLHWDGTAFTQKAANVGESLFTVHANGDRFASVGGYGTGILLENRGDCWVNVTPPGSSAINGVHLTATGGYASGADGMIYSRSDSGWQVEETGLEVYETLHSVWIDPKGGVWAVGGNVTSFPLVDGVLIHRAPGEKE
jgi:hypothetical protein